MTVRVFIAMGALVASGALGSCSSESQSDPRPGPSSASSESPLTAAEVDRYHLSACYYPIADGDTVAFRGPGLKLVSGPITVTGATIEGSPTLRLTATGAVRYVPSPEAPTVGYVGNRIKDVEPTEKPFVAGSGTALVGQTFAPSPAGVVPLYEVMVRWLPDVSLQQSATISGVTLTYLDAGGAEHTVSAPLDIGLVSEEGECDDRSHPVAGGS